jgi:hypothetical protein
MKNVRRPTSLALGLLLTISGLTAGAGEAVLAASPAGADACASNPADAVNSTPAGQTFAASGCYNISGDFTITASNITISGGVWNISGGMTVKGNSDTITGATLNINTNWGNVSPFYSSQLLITGQKNSLINDVVTVPNGMLIKGASTTLDGGSYTDPTVSPAVGPRHGASYKPIILVRDTDKASISNLSVTGAGNGVYNKTVVGEAGIKLETSDSDRIINVTTTNTPGDGLELVVDAPKHNVGVTRLFVDGLTVTGAGRHGVTLAEVGTPPGYAGTPYAASYQSTLNYINVVSCGLWAINFQSDIFSQGSGNVTMNNVTIADGNQGISVQELATGPITINNLNGSGHIYDNSLKHLAPQPPITINGGTWALPANDRDLWKAGIETLGGVLVIQNMTLNRQPSANGLVPPDYAAWASLVGDPTNPTQTGGVLKIISSTVVDPSGSYADANSTCGSSDPVYSGNSTYAPCTAPIN